MRAIRVAVLSAVTVVAGMTPASPSDLTGPGALTILGSVRDAARPVANALIIALNLNSFVTTQTWTSADGKFSLPPLESGIYKVIAVKAGFAPAITTIVPAKKAEHRVTLRLETENRSKTRDDEIWEIRGSLPSDVLREIDNTLASPVQMASSSYDVPRLKGQMMSMTGMAAAQKADSPAFAQTGIGVQSRIGDSFQIGIRGDMQRFDDPTDSQAFGDPVAQSNAMSMELRPSATDSVRFASTRSTWRYNNTVGDEEGPADLRSHNIEWEHGSATVKVHYFAHDNFFRPDFGSDVIEVAGDTPVLQTQHSDIGVSLRVRQETLRANSADSVRTANLGANGSLQVASAFTVRYGMASRIGYDRTEWAPMSGAEWKMTKNTALIGSASYKVLDSSPATALLPSLVAWSDDGPVLPRYSYSFGVVSSRDEQNRLSVIATVTAADAPQRVLISDGMQQFWDTLVVDTGDVRRDLRIAYRHDFGSRFAIDVATTAGTATPRAASADSTQKVYVTTDLQTIFTPTRTTIAIAYRGIQQPQPSGEYRSNRVNVRVAQSLYLPIDVNLLLGMELVHAQNSPYLLDTLLPEEGASKKYIAGLALNF